MERYVQNFFPQTFMSIFEQVPISNLETICLSNLTKRPIFVFVGEMHRGFQETLESKLFKHTKGRSSLIHIAVAPSELEKTFHFIEEGIEKQSWVLVENIRSLSGKNLMNFIKFVNERLI